MLQTIINTFTSFFSRSFWFGSFLPVLIVAFLHAVLLVIVYQPSWLTLDAVLTLGAADGAKITLLFALLVLAGYVLAPFVPLFRGLLDGSLLPRWLYDALLRGRRRGWRTATRAFSTAQVRSARANGLLNEIAELAKLRKAAELLLPGETAGIAQAEQAIQSAEAAVGALTEVYSPPYANKAKWLWPAVEKQGDWRRRWWRRSHWTSPDIELFRAAAAALGQAFAAHTAEEDKAGGRSEWARRLDAAHNRFTTLLQERAAADRNAFEAEARRNATLDLLGLQATRLGEVRRATELYSKRRYGADYEWIWPRLALVLPEENSGLAERLIDANSQLNFSILLIALFQTVPLVWLPLIFANGGPLWLLLVVGWVAPLANLCFYELAVQSQALFGGVIATAIDRHRWDLLTTLHQAMPPTLSAEREIWKRLADASEPGIGAELVYERPVRS